MHAFHLSKLKRCISLNVSSFSLSILHLFVCFWQEFGIIPFKRRFIAKWKEAVRYSKRMHGFAIILQHINAQQVQKRVWDRWLHEYEIIPI
jgi:hypothetical protein